MAISSVKPNSKKSPYLFVPAHLLAGLHGDRFHAVLLLGEQRQDPLLRRDDLAPLQVVRHVPRMDGVTTDRGQEQHYQGGQYGAGDSARHQVRHEEHYRLYGHEVE